MNAHGEDVSRDRLREAVIWRALFGSVCRARDCVPCRAVRLLRYWGSLACGARRFDFGREHVCARKGPHRVHSGDGLTWWY